MKKFLSVMLTLTMVFTFAACGNSGSESSRSASSQAGEQSSSTAPDEEASAEPQSSSASEENPATSESTDPVESSASLVVYFSWSGNTESVANEIQAQTGADIFEIVPAEPYTDDYNTLLDIAQEEQAEGARPAIADTVENFDQYDVVYFGYPNFSKVN